MQTIKELFSNGIIESREIGTIEKRVEELSFELSKKKLARLKDANKIGQRAEEIFIVFLDILESNGVKNIRTLTCTIDGITKAISWEKEQKLYETISKKEMLEKSIENQKNEIRTVLLNVFDSIESSLEKLDESTKDLTHMALSDTKLKGIEMLGILKETTTQALLTALEKGEDIESTIEEIAKNITYQAINEGEPTQKRLTDISRTVLDAAIEIADEEQARAKEIVKGTVYGIKEGIAKVIEKFNYILKTTPLEVKEAVGNEMKKRANELKKTQIHFVKLLKESAKSSKGASKNILNDIIKKQDTAFEKLKNLSVEAGELITEKLEELRSDATSLEKEIKTKASEQFDKIKEKAEEKISELKKETGIIENEIVHKTAKFSNEAKNLGFRAWQVAKGAVEGAVKGAKNAMHKEDKE